MTQTGNPPVYRIHPGIGIARLGDSPDSFCLSPEVPGALPTDCDSQGNPKLSPNGESEVPITHFKDAEGRIKRQAARFQIYVYDEDSPDGRPLRVGDPIEGGGNDGVLIDIQWRVHLANKKAVWYSFRQLDGEHGYADDHPLRNADITDPTARQKLIIDPGPQFVNGTTHRKAGFDRDRDGQYAPVFPPPLQPKSIDTLGELLTDDSGRLLVLGGHGNSGTWKFDQFGQPRIDSYANTDGWFDDTADGPVMARLVMYSKRVDRVRFVDVEGPAWVMVGYPRYAPQILDMVTLDDVLYDLGIRQFAARTDLYGTAGTFGAPQRIDAGDPGALQHWLSGKLTWNPDYRPWFYRDIWPILFRPDEMTYLTNVLQQSNFPHNQTKRGNFDPDKLGRAPTVKQRAILRAQTAAVALCAKGDLLLEDLAAAVALLDGPDPVDWEQVWEEASESGRAKFDAARKAAAKLAAVLGGAAGGEPQVYLARWVDAYAHLQDGSADETLRKEYGAARSALAEAMGAVAAALAERAGLAPSDDRLAELAEKVQKQYRAGGALRERFEAIAAEQTVDPNRPYRRYLYDLLRQPGEENTFRLGGKPNERTFNLPLMPLLNGDNPLSNTTPSKFLRLTDYQLYILRQWAEGKFYNEVTEGWVDKSAVDPYRPYADWKNDSGRKLDQGVLTNLLGGAFCPGGEVSWVIRNPSIYERPYRLKADPDFSNFQQTAAESNAQNFPPDAFLAADIGELSQASDFAQGLQPGDLTKYSALPWQADFNECTTQTVDITYELWNAIDPTSENDVRMKLQSQVWETLWWPAHRPLQVWEVAGMSGGSPNLQFLDWARGVPQTPAGDLKMVTEWRGLPFVVENPYMAAADLDTPSPDSKYIGVERS